MSSTVGYLIVGIWTRYQKAMAENEPEMIALKDLLSGETGLMQAVMDGALVADKTIDELIDWDEFDGVFDYEFVDESGRDQNSLDGCVWGAIVAQSTVSKAVEKWAKENMAKYLKE